MERLSKRWDSLTPKGQKMALGGGGVGVVGTVLGIGILGFGAWVATLAAEHRDAPRVSEYPRVQVENDSFRIARLAPTLAWVTVFGEPATEEQRDVLWTDIFESLQRDKPWDCLWTLKVKIHDNPPSVKYPFYDDIIL